MLRSFMRLWNFDSEIRFKVRSNKIVLIKNGGIKITVGKGFVVHNIVNI